MSTEPKNVNTRGRLPKIVVIGALILLAGAGGCSEKKANPVVVRVGGVPIRQSTVERWERAIENEGDAKGRRRSSEHYARTQALGTLISLHWLIGEARAQHFAPPGQAIKRGLAPSPGLTVADLELEVDSEAAARALREMTLRRVPAITRAAVVSYYRHHLRRFSVRRQRVADLIEGISSRAAALALRRRITTNAAFERKAIREFVERPEHFEAGGTGNGALVQQIFKARLGAIAPPVKFDSGWVLVLARRVVPPYIQPLNEEQSSIIANLLREAEQRKAIARFFTSYTLRWTARTSCRVGFVVQKCAQYDGAEVPEENPLRATS